MKINFLKPKKNFKKKNLELNSNFYWKIIMFSVFILTAVSFVFGYYMFVQVKDEASSSAGNVNQKQPIEKQRLEKVLDIFSAREKKSNEILNSPAPVVDPSL
ncbi:MAG: hypothetical protein KGL67_00785 [Patescibacteria group bacterium]|nr:hypothetical protein [Patescibacteria group bacterium]